MTSKFLKCGRAATTSRKHSPEPTRSQCHYYFFFNPGYVRFSGGISGDYSARPRGKVRLLNRLVCLHRESVFVCFHTDTGRATRRINLANLNYVPGLNLLSRICTVTTKHGTDIILSPVRLNVREQPLQEFLTCRSSF